MSEVHEVTSSPRANELVEVVLAEFDRWAQYAPGQAAGVIPNDAEVAARFALADVRAELMDHLVVPIAVTLASWGVGTRGTEE